MVLYILLKRRHRLCNLLRQGPKKASELKEIVNKSQPTLNIRLNKMADDVLVVKQKGYWLIPSPRLKILKLIEELEKEK
ncbi:ArsR family transcriptional regulator [archaeon]|nr:ArsR family transcriptional regulator [archaeon]